jgi:hypothetical protein
MNFVDPFLEHRGMQDQILKNNEIQAILKLGETGAM